MKRITIGGAAAAVHIESPSSPLGLPDLVLVHGAGFDHTVFRYQSRYFAGRGHRVFAVDLPGHGASDGPPLGSIPEMGTWLAQAMTELRCAEVVLIGHSMGSFIAMEAAAAGNSSSVQGLVLIASSDRMRVHPELAAAAADRDRHAIDLMVGWMHTGSHRLGGHRSAGSWSAGSSRAVLERNLDALGGDLSACASYDPIPAAERLAVPTLVVSAETDKMTPVPAAAQLAGRIERCRHVIVPGGGHVALFDQSAEVNSAIIGHLAEFDRA